MADPLDASAAGDSGWWSSGQASSHPRRDARLTQYHAAERKAHARTDNATARQAPVQRSPLIHPPPPPSPQQRLYSFDPYAQTAWDWDWAQAVDVAPQPTPHAYEPQGELVQEERQRTHPAPEFSSLQLVDPLAPPPRPLPTMKRKSDADRDLQALAQQPAVGDASNPPKRRAVSRASSTSQSPAPTVPADAPRKESDADSRRVVESAGAADLLPAGRVFPIQIGSALFRLSGASLCSDAPSYFSHFFSEQLHSAAGRPTDIKTLYIDRDPDTFRDIALHLQGYHVVPRDGEHFVKLFADAQFYSLPRLTKQLFTADIFVDIAGTPFRIPRDSFAAPGNSPNYFSLGFAQWFSTPSEVFPGLDRNALLRPPSISPPSVPNKSGDIFADLIKMLQGYDVEIRSDTHRANLLRDARYFHLKGLEQRLIPCETSFNLKRGHNEILIRLEDIRQSGIAFLPDSPPADSSQPPNPGPGTVTYARPYTDDATLHHHLVLETSASEPATLHLHPSESDSNFPPAHASFHGDTLRRISTLLTIVASKLSLHPSSLSAPTLRVRINGDTSLTLDGADAAFRPQTGDMDWVVKRAHWRVRVESANGEAEPLITVLDAVKIDAFSGQKGRNATRGFLA